MELISANTMHESKKAAHFQECGLDFTPFGLFDIIIILIKKAVKGW